MAIAHQPDCQVFYMKVLIFCELSRVCICINALLTIKGFFFLYGQTDRESWATFTLLNIIMYNWHNIFSCQFSRNCESIACIIFGKVRMWMKMSKKFQLRNCWLLQIFFIFSVRLSLISLDYFLGWEHSVEDRVEHLAVYVRGPVKNLYKSTSQ